MLPHAQGSGCALGRTGTWLVLEFYCVPARAWHSHEIGIGRTGKCGSRKDEEEWSSKIAVGRSQDNRKKSKVEGGDAAWQSVVFL